MDTEEIDLLDVLAYNSSELFSEFENLDEESERKNAIESYLRKHSESKVEQIDDFQKDLDWFNVTEPIRMADLKGKLIVLDFFTYCCINCMHILPDLKLIEDSFSVEKGLVVIGVHSAKFDNEKDSANLLSAIQRYNITHPVVNDSNSSMWLQLKIKCWPTIFIISPSGKPLLVLMGEGHRLFLNQFIATAVSFYNVRGEVSSSSLPLNPSTNLMRASNLRFPSKISCFANENQELFAVSDSGNNRILIINSNGDVLEKIGGFQSGFVDGNFYRAKFNSPQGLAFLNANELFIADTGNHAIRKICLRDKYVSTVVGNGKQGNDKVGGLIGTKQEISSPWDIVVYSTRDMDMSFHVDEKSVPAKNVLLIAMAGTHQIWGFFLDGIIWWKFKKYEPLSCAAIIGNGSEENRNNSYPQNAAFAQPSGLSLFKDMLFIADSESSSIRKASMLDGKVTAVVGGDRNPLNLFSFGDIDGKQYFAKLQHPLDVCHNTLDGYLYVTDTYNHKIKRVDIANNTVETCAIRDSIRKEVFQFSEPDGVCIDSNGKRLYVVDTNNHTIQVIDLETMLTWPLVLKFNKLDNNESKIENMVILEKTIKINKICKLNLNAKFSCDNNVKLTSNAPQKWNLHLPNKGFSAEQTSGFITEGSFLLIVNANYDDASERSIELNCYINICSGSVCMYKKLKTQIKLIYDSESHINVTEDLVFSIKPDGVFIL